MRSTIVEANTPTIGPITGRYIVRAFGEDYLELCRLPAHERRAMLEERWRQGGTIDDAINAVAPSEFFPTLAAAKRAQSELGPIRGDDRPS